jgi:hypothetical protein
LKHYSFDALERAVDRASAERHRLRTDEDLLAELRAQLDQPGGKDALAARLGLSAFNLSLLLRGRGQLSDKVAERLGYRRVTRFERIG